MELEQSCLFNGHSVDPNTLCHSGVLWWHLLWLFKEKGSETTSFQTSLALQWQGCVGTQLTSGISQLQTKLARHLGCACSSYQQQERNSCSRRVSCRAWAQRQYQSRRKHREELENKKSFGKKNLQAKVGLDFILQCFMVQFYFLWPLFNFCVRKTYGVIFFPLPFLKKYFSLVNQLIPLPPENNVYQDFFWVWTASERCFVFLVGYGMCPFGWGTEIWNNRAAKREGNIGSSKQKNSWTGEKCYWWKDKGNSVIVACCVLCSPWFSKYIYLVNINGAYLIKYCL